MRKHRLFEIMLYRQKLFILISYSFFPTALERDSMRQCAQKLYKNFKQGYSEPDTGAYILHAMLSREKCCSKTTGEGITSRIPALIPSMRCFPEKSAVPKLPARVQRVVFRCIYPPCDALQRKVLFQNYRRGYNEQYTGAYTLHAPLHSVKLTKPLPKSLEISMKQDLNPLEI